MCRKAKYILQKITPKIKQSAIQLAINQLFQKQFPKKTLLQKLKSRGTNKQGLSLGATSLVTSPTCALTMRRINLFV
jgi:hypothetical protein